MRSWISSKYKIKFRVTKSIELISGNVIGGRHKIEHNVAMNQKVTQVDDFLWMNYIDSLTFVVIGCNYKKYTTAPVIPAEDIVTVYRICLWSINIFRTLHN